MNNKTVAQAWKERGRLREEGFKILEKIKIEIPETTTGGNGLAESYKLIAENKKLLAEVYNLVADGDIVFLNAIIAAYGNIKVEWKKLDEQDFECRLENGEVYKPE